MKVILKNIPAVGMHHDIGRGCGLNVLETFEVIREPLNAIDENALKLKNDQGERVAYIARDYAKYLTHLFTVKIEQAFAQVVEDSPKVRVWERGPEQFVNVAIELPEHFLNMTKHLLKNIDHVIYM